MTMRVRAGLTLMLALVMMGLGSCGHYNCATSLFSTCSTTTTPPPPTGSATAFAFAVDQTGTINGYTVNATAGTFKATPSFVAPAIPAGDPGVGMVVVQKQFVYAVFELENKIYGWSVNATTGALTLLSGFPLTLSLNAPIVSYNEYNVATDPAGTLLFISDTANSRIFVYQIAASGALTAVTNSPFTTGVVQPGNLTTDGLGRYLYVTAIGSNHQGTEVLGYSIGTGTNLGVLTAITGSPFAFPMWQLQGDPSGAFLIGTTGSTVHLSGADDKHLYVFNILTSGTTPGAISEVAGSPFTTQFSPFNVAVSPAPASAGTEFLYSFSLNDAGAYNPVEGYRLDTTTGALSAITGSPFATLSTGHWGQFDQSGTLLFVYSDVLGGATSTQLASLAVSSTGLLTQPIPSLTLPTAGYWVVTDP
jgi:Lactonase, 7-bladed beta-propeller